MFKFSLNIPNSHRMRVPDGASPAAFSTERESDQRNPTDRTQSVMLPSEPHPHDMLSVAEKQVIEAINSARTNPAGFAERLVQMKARLGADNVLRFEWG